jgi:hypothetical protein
MVWIGLFFVLFIVAELYQSVKDVQLPFPVYLILGAVLAVASNYDRHATLSSDNSAPERVSIEEIVTPQPQLPPHEDVVRSIDS